MRLFNIDAICPTNDAWPVWGPTCYDTARQRPPDHGEISVIEIAGRTIAAFNTEMRASKQVRLNLCEVCR